MTTTRRAKTLLIVIVTVFACVPNGDNGGAVATALLSFVRREAEIAASSSLAKATAFTTTTSSSLRPWLTQKLQQQHRRRRSQVELDVGVSNRPRGYDAAIDISELAPRDIPSFENWAYEYGIQRAEGHVLTSHDHDRMGVLDIYASTTTDMPTGKCVLYVPEPLILTSTKAMAELRTSDMSEAEKILYSINAGSERRHYYLLVKLLVEYEKGESSPWFAWLNSLPRYYTNAASMTPFCCLCLPSLMRKLAVSERGNMSRLSISSIKMIPYLNEDTKYDVELCNWVYQIVYTRAVEIPIDGELRIIPMGDMFNHGSDYTEIEASYDELGNYYAYTTYDVPAGSPLRISYADPTNPSFLFARYGFLDEMTPATFCKLIIEHVNKDLEELGYAENRMLFYKEGTVSEEVWDVLLYQHLSSTKIGDKRLLMESHKIGDYETKQSLHGKYYRETSQILLDHLNNFLEQLDQLSMKSEERQRNIDDNPRLPLILRHNAFVRDTFLNVRNKYFGY